ncbi:MAG: hypothetical protein PHD36_05180 [Desulfotomaculaceae bacterium]|nr:hypothetical protein [Desulfotomaculaceae bacterium]
MSLHYYGDSKLVLLSTAIALLAAALAWQLNRLLKNLPDRYLFFLAPFQEEAVKTFPAIYMGVSIFFIHVLFGAVEAVWEIFSCCRNGFFAGLAALASHSAFGFITASTYALYDASLPAIFAGYLAHISWNYVVMLLATRRRKN